MGKSSRRPAAAKAALNDARRLLHLARLVADDAARAAHPGDRHLGEVMHNQRGLWERTDRILLRCDPDLVGALLDTARDSEIGSHWLSHLPYRSVAVVLTDPLRIPDGERICIYHGFFAAGVRVRKAPLLPTPDFVGPKGGGALWTTYHSLDEGEDVRLIWLFSVERTNEPGAQTVSVPVTGPIFTRPRTVGDLIEQIGAAYAATGAGASDASLLVPVGLLILMYLASEEPDITSPPALHGSSGQAPGGAVIADLGLRVGSAIRQYRREAAEPEPDGPARAGGWRLPPHIRSAHWRRSRIAKRADDGTITGDVHGTHGEDWDYAWRWIPPTPVNVTLGGPPPTVRRVAQHGAESSDGA